EKVRCLRISLVFQSGAAPGVALASDQQLAKALGPSKCVDGFQQLEKRGRPKLSGTMHGGMVTRGQDSKLTITVGDLEAIAKLLDERNPGLLVPAMARPLIRRRERLAKIVRESRKAHDCRSANFGRISHN